MKKCLYCYKELKNNEIDFHSACSKKMFGTSLPPVLDFDNEHITEMARQIVVRSIAVTGVQPKLSMQLQKQSNQPPRLTLVGLFGDYILKPQSVEYKELPQNEDLTMHLAELAKIKTAKHTLIRLKSGDLAYITQRFDREKNKKIAMEDFCQLSENLTEHKYRSSVEKVGKILLQYAENKGFEAQRLFELVLFNFLVGNADMHLKNYALLKNPLGQYELSPAYDLLSTALVIPDDREESALTLNGKKNKLTQNDFDILANSLKINEKSVQSIYKRFERILPKWEDFIRESFLSGTMQEAYISLIKQKHQQIFTKKHDN
ncbi:MAG: HipA domain-containing protein [Capnocytophaga sp.]|nr:HipA domain-containing protein [Capnocytophaga sp.]